MIAHPAQNLFQLEEHWKWNDMLIRVSPSTRPDPEWSLLQIIDQRKISLATTPRIKNIKKSRHSLLAINDIQGFSLFRRMNDDTPKPNFTSSGPLPPQ